mgnify:CR=1 FL=1
MNSKLILGTVQFGLNYGINNSLGQLPKTSIFEILDYAYANGIKILDTAESYGNSQEIIGEFIKSNPKKKFKIITKLSASKDISKIKLDKVFLETLMATNNQHIVKPIIERRFSLFSDIDNKLNHRALW